jgi:HPt (histidine-containing phosphotransfer) domain-containing protein
MEIAIPEEIRTKYLVRRQKDIETLRASINSRQLDDFKRIGHQLKGNAASFGYSELEKIAIAMETAAEKNDSFEAGKQLEAFEKWLSEKSTN